MLQGKHWLVVGLGIFINSSLAYAGSSDSEKAIQYIRSFFDEDTTAPKKAAEGLGAEHAQLLEFSSNHFQPKDIWGNHDYVFGYGNLADGSTVLFAWKNQSEAQDISLKDLSSIYEDERMAAIQDEKDFKRWKKMRETVAGAFINVRKGDSHFSEVFPNPKGEKTGRESLEGLVVASEPVVLRFSPIHIKTNNLLSSVDRVPTR